MESYQGGQARCQPGREFSRILSIGLIATCGFIHSNRLTADEKTPRSLRDHGALVVCFEPLGRYTGGSADLRTTQRRHL